MRTLKKSLCLVLALVMMLGLCAVNVSATSFTDDEEIGANYKEAAEVLTYIGVFTGQDDGNFDPDVALKRKDACHLVTRLLNVDLGGGSTIVPFSDVADADKAAVAYMASQGITNGYEDNTFRPENPLTGAMFAKWLLVALGYNADIEKMTGSSWEVYTQNLTDEIGLAKGIPGYNKTATITREQAAQMCLNALQADMVRYEGGVHVETGEANVTVNSNRSKVGHDSSSGYKVGTNDGIMQLCEMKYPDLKLTENRDNVDEENMSTPLARTWKYKSAEVYRVYADPIWSSNGAKVNKSTVSGDLSSYYIAFGGDSKRYVTDSRTWNSGASADAIISVNGATVGQVETAIAKATFSINDTSDGLLTFKGDGATMASAIADMTADGRLVEIYATDKEDASKITNIVITCYTLAKVDNVTVSGGTTTYKFAAVSGGAIGGMGERKVYADTPNDNGLIVDAPLAKGDYVTLTYSGSGTADTSTKLCAYPTTVYTGTQTSRSNKDTVIIDGTTYAVAAGVSRNASTYSDNRLTTGGDKDFANGKGDFIFDQYGYLVWSTPTAKSSDYAFIVNAAGKFNDGGLDAATPEITVRAVLSDGTIHDYKVATDEKDSIDTGYYAKQAVQSSAAGQWDSNDSVVKGDELSKIVVIKNTGIVVGKGNKMGSVSVGESIAQNTTAVNEQAKLLMSDLYGYVYNYKINDKGEIELTPIVDDTNKINGYDTYSSYVKDKNMAYVGQTTANIEKGKLSYTSVNRAKNYAQPGAAADNTALTGTTNSDTILVGSSTTIIVYDKSKPTNAPKVYKGLSSLPNLPADGSVYGIGYYVAKTGGTVAAEASADTLTADVVFIAKANPVPSDTTKEYIYVDITNVRVADENGKDVYYYVNAYHQDGSGKFEVHSDKKLDDSGLYNIDENNKITGNRIAETAITEDISGKEVISIETAKVNGNFISATGGNGTFEKNDNTVTITVKDKAELKDGAKLVLILDKDNGSVTTRIKTIYVLGNA